MSAQNCLGSLLVGSWGLGLRIVFFFFTSLRTFLCQQSARSNDEGFVGLRVCSRVALKIGHP